ncbi:MULTISPECIES: F0F1 ATP synthase subunit B [Brevibacillus]|uniref:ATP synthase subunit b n=1 Tax=Brevibacillus laterosporus TaxID=1465 RepID=A0AAP8U5S3_BRELA|nr:MULTISPECIES: F0F1 ATP synthase subunit B [Brevibacillus]ATO49177.1 ATP synthase F0 subunit B [Brevibacillus laterosporus DSM 25]AYB40739.1 ATP synthase F0 subunit B [Brevibacillus laterosporus]MBG9773198.1 ATP synthase F0F1 subunit B [Brevibacillus laterosporus]MBG9787723.1 ATP synthase F0F1 subunit B [Brevibacillus laterosporus]MBG9803576.1 ATP synthase F0F1 subunit B [Brevibacillus laterosporus]
MLEFGAVTLEGGTMLFQVLAFLILLLVVRKYAVGPITQIMEKRRQYVASEIEAAERNRKEAEGLLAEQRRLLDEARQETKALIERATRQAQEEEARIKKEAEETAARLKAEASAEIARETEKAKEELRTQMASLSVLLASKIIEKELDEATQKSTIDQFLKQVGDRL